MFGEKISESPRVPSPWGAPRRSSATPPRQAAPRASSSQARKSSSSSSPSSVSPLRASPQLPSGSSPLAGPALCAIPSVDPTSEDSSAGLFSLDPTTSSSREDLTAAHAAPAPAIAISPSNGAGGSLSARLRPEPDEMGNLEYKLRMLPTTRHRYDRLLTQLKWRLLQGGGVCTYEIGVLDDGRCVGICEAEMRTSLEVLGALAAELDASVRIRRAFAVEAVDQDVEYPAASAAASGRDNEEATSLRGLSNEQVRQRLLRYAADMDLSGCAGACLIGREMGAGQATTEGRGPFSVFIASRPVTDEGPSSRTFNVDVDIELEQDDDAVSGQAAPSVDVNLSNEGSSRFDGQNEEMFGEVFHPDDDGLADFTFSLSLDERETRDGVGYRRPPKKKQQQQQQQQKDRDMEARMLGLAEHDQGGSSPSGGAEAPVVDQHVPIRPTAVLKQSVSDTAVEQGALQPSDDAVDAAQHAAASKQAEARKGCQRVIVEAVVLRTVAEDAYIDYASL
ncbi:hypothetical protein FA10DRAFT_298742 [Acaromyces ingoldii]|uniref:Uncharacterized protein n=1 Tax=Acaromyces ingoldii TaxID=215250 RepID=A0A316YVY2_9BASI|nr:hypothetical protein FA10DRAFT_298742 [Acaromyces ingoldii]PWN93341.1 hypothetical protein FA10DRAFT_298742 [Acaromyces ingoldii]